MEPQRIDLSPEVIVIIDTSELFSEEIDKYIGYNTKKIILEVNCDHNYRVEWFVPNLVLNERDYQVIEKINEYKKCYKQLSKIFKLPEDPFQDVEIIVSQMKTKVLNDCRFKEILLNTKDVNWEKIIDDSVKRKVPFSHDLEEKGFRDAVILETAFQYFEGIRESNKKLVFSTGDQLLKEAVNLKAQKLKMKIDVFGINEIISKLNQYKLPENVQEFIKIMFNKAETLFFRQDDNESLFYLLELPKIITEKYEEKISEIPEGYDSFLPINWEVESPQFVNYDDEKNIIYWRSRVQRKLHAFNYKIGNVNPVFYSPSSDTLIYPSGTSTAFPQVVISGGFSGSISNKFIDPTNPNIYGNNAAFNSYSSNYPQGYSQLFNELSYIKRFIIPWSIKVDNEKNILNYEVDEERIEFEE